MNGDSFRPVGMTGPDSADALIDFAEALGAVRLMRQTLEAVQSVTPPALYFKASPEDPMFGFPALLTTVAYALARGIVDPDVLEGRLGFQPDLRYLCANRFPDATTIRAFLELHGELVATVLYNSLAATETGGGGMGLTRIQYEVDRRLAMATDPRLPLAA